MLSFWAQMRVVAYRDFKAMVGQPVFLMFLLAPLFMALMGVLGGSGPQNFIEKSSRHARIAVIADASLATYYKAADAQLRGLYFERATRPPQLVLIPRHGSADAAIARSMINAPGSRVEAVVFGPPNQPQIIAASRDLAVYMTAVAEFAATARQSGAAPGQKLVNPRVELSQKSGGTARAPVHRISGGACYFRAHFVDCGSVHQHLCRRKIEQDH